MGFQELLHHGSRADFRGRGHGRGSVVVLRAHIRSCIQQVVDELRICGMRGPVKGRCSIGVTGTRIGARTQQVHCGAAVIALRGPHKL